MLAEAGADHRVFPHRRFQARKGRVTAAQIIGRGSPRQDHCGVDIERPHTRPVDPGFVGQGVFFQNRELVGQVIAGFRAFKASDEGKATLTAASEHVTDAALGVYLLLESSDRGLSHRSGVHSLGNVVGGLRLSFQSGGG